MTRAFRSLLKPDLFKIVWNSSGVISLPPDDYGILCHQADFDKLLAHPSSLGILLVATGCMCGTQLASQIEAGIHVS